jgi:hypothetical protein
MGGPVGGRANGSRSGVTVAARVRRASDRLTVPLIGGLCVFALGLGMSATSQATPRSRLLNPIQQENALPGSDSWLFPAADDRAIEGYASEASVQPGDTVHFHVSTTPEASYQILVYRLGWYGGAGARLVACLPDCSSDESGTSRTMPASDLNGEIDAGWPVTDQLTVPATWVSGYYLVDFLLASGPEAGRAAISYVIVRDPPGRQSTILVQVPVNTWQAYNAWGGKSLYNDQSTGGRRATYVSFNRPYLWEPLPGGLPLEWEDPLVRFLERGGYDVSYQTDVDTDANPGSLLQHRLVVTAGHGEYWTKVMRDAFDNARDMGTNLAFMGANTGYWQIRYEDGGRTIVAYKSRYDPEPDPALKTTMFRDLVPPRYECELLGIQSQGVALNWPPSDYVVQADAIGDPWFANTGFTAGDIVKGIVSVESDTIPGTQTAASSCDHKLTVFFHHETGSDQTGNADAVRYTAPSGAIVFASGSHTFAWGLDDYAGNPDETHGLADPRLQRFMQNALNDLTRTPTPTPTAPPPPPSPPPVKLTAGKVRLTPPRAGKPFTASMVVRNGGEPVRGNVGCVGKLAGRALRAASSHASAANGKASCTWNLPAGARGKRFSGSITEAYKGSKVGRLFSTKVK